MIITTTTHATGAVRSSDADGTRYDLITPIGLRRLAETCKEGADRYGDFNWEKGFPIADLLNHAIRHVYLYLAGDRSEDHLSHAAWNVLGAIHSEELWPELNEGRLRAPGCRPPAGVEPTSSQAESAGQETTPRIIPPSGNEPPAAHGHLERGQTSGEARS
jgi:hypothetical protein